MKNKKYLLSFPKKAFLWCCRAYSRNFVKDKPADKFFSLLCAGYFFGIHGYWPNFNKPRSLSEKIWCRMLYERNPLWTTFSDKLKRNEFLRSKLSGGYAIPLLWTGTNPEEIPFDQLPDQFVIKANHGSGYNIIIQDKGTINRSKIIGQLQEWLDENYCENNFAGMEWSYRNIKPSLLIETFLGSTEGIPADYKFFCYSGRAEFVQVDHGRYSENHLQTYLDRDYIPLKFDWGNNPSPTKLVCPDNYGEMIRLAEHLASDLDFIRVDLYSIAGHIYVGELTCSPAAGIIRITPQKYDFFMGEKWHWAGTRSPT